MKTCPNYLLSIAFIGTIACSFTKVGANEYEKLYYDEYIQASCRELRIKYQEQLKQLEQMHQDLLGNCNYAEALCVEGLIKDMEQIPTKIKYIQKKYRRGEEQRARAAFLEIVEQIREKAKPFLQSREKRQGKARAEGIWSGLAKWLTVMLAFQVRVSNAISTVAADENLSQKLSIYQNDEQGGKGRLLQCSSSPAPFYFVENSKNLECTVYQTLNTALEREYFYEGMYYKKNNFGDIFPLWEDIPLEKLSARLSSFVESLKEKESGTPFIIEVPHAKAQALESIKKAGFTLHHADNDKTTWIVKNNSPLPAPFTSVAGAQILVVKNGEILALEEKTRPGLLGFPAGNSEPNELARYTAPRELKEETNLEVNPDKLKLIALINRLRANQYGASGHNYYYLTHEAQGTIQTQPEEIAQAFWIPLEELASKDTVHGLKVSPFQKALAKHILDDCPTSGSKTFLDYRQLSKPENARNPNDIMIAEFFKQDCSSNPA